MGGVHYRGYADQVIFTKSVLLRVNGVLRNDLRNVQSWEPDAYPRWSHSSGRHQVNTNPKHTGTESDGCQSDVDLGGVYYRGYADLVMFTMYLLLRVNGVLRSDLTWDVGVYMYTNHN